MNRNTLALTAFAPLLALALACGGGGGGSTATSPATVATPVVTAPNYLGIGGAAVTVTTQAQSGCAYAWTLSGDNTARITSGQGTNSITLTANGTTGTALQASVTVQAETGSSSASGSATITEAVPPPAPQIEIRTATDQAVAGQVLDFSSVETPVPANPITTTWKVTGGTIASGQGTTGISVTTGTPSPYPGFLNIEADVTDTLTGLTATNTLDGLPIFDGTGTLPSVPVLSGPSTAKGGTNGLVYSTPAQPGYVYLWDVYDGMNQLPALLTAGADTHSVTITAPAYGLTPPLGGTANTYWVYCTVYGPGGLNYASVKLTITQ